MPPNPNLNPNPNTYNKKFPQGNELEGNVRKYKFGDPVESGVETEGLGLRLGIPLAGDIQGGVGDGEERPVFHFKSSEEGELGLEG
jgi:hypothetical protein